MIALVLGVGSGVGLGFWRDWRDGESLNEPTPRAARSRKQTERLAGASDSVAAPPVPVEVSDTGDTHAGGAADDPGPNIATDIRQIYDAVRANHKKAVGATVLIVATHEGDDITTAALQLSSIAAETQRVLLLDADVNRRTLSALVPGQPEAGLVDVAVGRKVLAGAVVQDLRTKITALPLMAPTSRRKGAINEEDLKAAFEQTKRFDLVIVVAPNYDKDPSARFFAALVDHVVLVHKPGEAGRRALDQLVATLHIDVRKVRGTVLMNTKAA
jgi:Mrp family chromosome partitioning ATPase